MYTRLLIAGYEGQTIATFIQRLSFAGVELLVDVRALPLSRKPGFSKRALVSHLEEAGIDYVHLRKLGMPNHLRRQRHDLPDNRPILDAYEALLPSQDEYVSLVVQMAGDRQVCLMCFESDESQCHRSRLAAYLQARNPRLSISSLPA